MLLFVFILCDIHRDLIIGLIMYVHMNYRHLLRNYAFLSFLSNHNQIFMQTWILVYTMLQNFSVKAARCENSTIWLNTTKILRENKSWRMQTVKNVHFGTFRGSEFWLVNLSHFSSPKFTKIQSWESLKIYFSNSNFAKI